MGNHIPVCPWQGIALIGQFRGTLEFGPSTTLGSTGKNCKSCSMSSYAAASKQRTKREMLCQEEFTPSKISYL